MARVVRITAAALLLVLAACTSDSGFPEPARTTTSIERRLEAGRPGEPYPSAPTGQKPQSKLWYAAGTWWGALYDPNSADFRIFGYRRSSNTWWDTGIAVDERAKPSVDALWDGTHLYLVTAGTDEDIPDQSPRVARYSYLPKGRSWRRDPGFPVTIASGGVEAAVIAKDSTGLVWVTYTQRSKVWVGHSSPADDASWTRPYQVPAPGEESEVNPDEISTIVAYAGNKMGVMWSNQRTQVVYFATHVDGSPDRSWSITRALDRPKGADDHINVKSVIGDPSGQVFAAVKTSLTRATDPLVMLLVLRPDGTWTATTFGTVADAHSRPMVMLDTEHRDIYMFAATPCCSGGKIYYKKSRMDAPSFAPGLGTEILANAKSTHLNNPTSTKQNVNGSTDLMVMAADSRTRSYTYGLLALPG